MVRAIVTATAAMFGCLELMSQQCCLSGSAGYQQVSAAVGNTCQLGQAYTV